MIILYKQIIKFQNSSSLTPKFLYNNFNKKILLNFNLKTVIQQAGVKFGAFLKQNGCLMCL